MRRRRRGYPCVSTVQIIKEEMHMAGPPTGPGPSPHDPTTPLVPPGAPGAYAPPEQRFDRPAHYDPYDAGPDRAAEAAAFARRHIRTPETKEFFKTSEFFVW